MMQAHPMAIPRDPTTAERDPTTAERDPTTAEIAHFLTTRSGEEMVRLVQAIRAPAAQASFTTTMLHMQPAVVSTSAPLAAPEKTKKALNAFVGYRCYYILIPVFKPWPMKKLSNLMGVMWEADPNKSLWSLLTKAWSAIRDQIGKDKAPLHTFLQIMCPYLNIPSPEKYLTAGGWTLTADDDGNPRLSKGPSPSPDTFSARIEGTALSVEDIINHCQSMGYAVNYNIDSETLSPTFLAQSGDQKSTPVQSTYENRLAARNRRRVRRQTTRGNDIVPALQQEIANAHGVSNTDVMYQDNSVFEQSEPVQFYDDLAGLLTDNLGQNQQVAPSVSDNFVAAGDPMMAGWTDRGAFRLGADENATLPSFSFATL
ncbi:hypothetical protein OPT61_g6517 [Boeremia exigua]|uniref:Uncharacterized protein n=1 Tax=Boeremia exigua TaxID=749465 RepID=A0ACC2I6C4_9PLEO|nr:hypothetical protein OPT61_g6517 [Boeremia exigua]